MDDALEVATDAGHLALTILLTLAFCIPAVLLGVHLSHKLFPQPQRPPEQAAMLRRIKRLFLLYCGGFLVLAGLLWWLTGSLLAGVGITLGVMVALQLIVFGLVTQRKAQLRKSKS